MRQNLAASLTLMFGDEGGYSNRAGDAGGPTNWGVTQKTLSAKRGRPVTAEEVKALTIEEATDIYSSTYWTQSGGDLLPAGLDYETFDFGVNSGPVTAVKKLQEVLGVQQDGWVGTATVTAAGAYPGGIVALIKAYADRRMAYLRSLKGKTGFATNGRGWTIRVTGVDPKGEYPPAAGVIGNALAMAGGAAVAPRPADKPAPDEASSKAPPPRPNPWLAPSVVVPIATTAVAGGGIVATGNGPFQFALAFALMVGVLIGAYYAFQHIRASSP